MLSTYWGIVRDGRIEPREAIGLPEGATVLITFLEDSDRAAEEDQAAERNRAAADRGERWETDTDDPRPAALLAKRLEIVSRPIKRDDSLLPVDPDDFPLF